MTVPPDIFLSTSGTFACVAGGKVICGYQCEYCSAAYQDKLFAQLAIEFPAQLRNAVVKRRSEYLAGRFCAQQLLTLLGLKAARSDVRVGKNREPIWPKGVVGSISHTDNMAVCVATTDPDVLGLGIDVEKEIRSNIASDITQQIVDTDEEKVIRTYFRGYNQGLTVVFSAKESVFKAANRLVGHYFDFSAMRVVRVHADQMVFAVAKPLSEHFQVGVEIPVNFTINDLEIRTVTCLTRWCARHI